MKIVFSSSAWSCRFIFLLYGLLFFVLFSLHALVSFLSSSSCSSSCSSSSPPARPHCCPCFSHSPLMKTREMKVKMCLFSAFLLLCPLVFFLGLSLTVAARLNKMRSFLCLCFFFSLLLFFLIVFSSLDFSLRLKKESYESSEDMVYKDDEEAR